MFLRRKAADYFTSEEQSTSADVDANKGEEGAQDEGKRSGLRRSTRLQSTPFSSEPDTAARTRKNVLRPGREAVKQTPRVEISVYTKRTLAPQGVVPTSPSVDDSFVDAHEQPNSPVQEHSQRSDAPLVKSPTTEDQYVSAVEDISDSLNLNGDSSILEATPRPSHTQNTLDNIPSSQPRPRSERSPVPLEPVPSSPAPASPSQSTPASQTKSPSASAQPFMPLRSPSPDNSGDSDDEAPEPISLSQSRSQALASRTKISQQNRLLAEKAREKRRNRDVLLASQKQSKKRPAETIAEQTEEEVEDKEAPDSQQSVDVESGNTTDTPAPNQAHQAARVARHADALPVDILRAASSTWFKDSVGEKRDDTVVKKKRKVNDDDGIHILEEMNFDIAPKAGKIGLVKEKMIMRMGKGQRRMLVGRFAR